MLAGTNNFDDTYRRHRPMIERTITWLVKDNNRRLRYRGVEANNSVGHTDAPR